MEVAIDMGLYNTPKGFTSQLNLCSASKVSDMFGKTGTPYHQPVGMLNFRAFGG